MLPFKKEKFWELLYIYLLFCRGLYEKQHSHVCILNVATTVAASELSLA